MRHFIFDVDGTLTPSRGVIDTNFAIFFQHFCINNPVYIVTGSDRPKTIEQIGSSIYNLCKRVYQCSGNDVWEQNKLIRSEKIKIPKEMFDVFIDHLKTSKFPIRTGNNIDIRPGLVNFSIIGRQCTKEERMQYVLWDKETGERSKIAENLRLIFPDYDIQVAGETGIDIMEKGKDKSQIIKDFNLTDELYFFGDKMEPDGNDYTLSLRVAQSGGNVHQVKGWEHTWEILKKL